MRRRIGVLMMSILISMIMMLGFLGGSSDGCLEEERIALLNLKPFFNLPPYYVLNSWVEEKGKGEDCCGWEGVECNNLTTRRVILITLSLKESRYFDFEHYYQRWDARDELGWYLNASLFLPFKQLKSLDLSYNYIAGCLENEGFDKLSSALSNLESLDLGCNLLNDSILSSLTHLSSLKHLILWGNQLTGSSHPNGFKWLSRLSDLETLDLRANFFKNNILSHMGTLSSLKTLILFDNKLEGTLDMQELKNLTKLKKLDLTENRIERLQPSYQDNGRQLKILTHLEELDLRANQLQGSIDIKDFNHLINLKKLDLSMNNIESLRSFQDSGRQLEILTHLEDLNLEINSFNNFSEFAFLGSAWIPNLKSLDISGNRMNGSIDMKELSAFTNLEELHMMGNQLNEFTANEGWCDLRNLKVLDISWNAIQGTLTSFLGNLTSLRYLDISNNQYSGNLDPLANLTSLRYLSVSRNHLEVPMSFSFLANLTNLKVLLCDENKLVKESTFPAWAPELQLNGFSCSNSTILGDGQQLSLQPPEFLHYQYDLRYVDLSYNNFSETIPIWLLENNTKLEKVFLTDNSFSGSLLLPSSLSLSSMSTFDISNNKIQGPIPTNICSTFPHLEGLVLSGNAFEGNIPPCLGDMKELSFLDLSHNRLLGEVPKELTMGSSSLAGLRLSNNNLSGKIHPTFFKSSKLQDLYLDGNKFVGEIHDDINISSVGFPSLLRNIDLSNNKLFGKIPRWIWNLSYLQGLSLSNNHFEGSIPVELCNMNRLEFLDLSQNNLSGIVPSCFNPPYIKHVHLSKNRLSGLLSTGAFYNSSSLVTLDLRENNLTGNIPNWIGTLSALSILDLKANYFEGKIPLELCSLSSLSIVDLSHNMLSGLIPSCLSNLTLKSASGKSSTFTLFYSALYGEGIGTAVDTGLHWLYPYGHFYPYNYLEQQVEFTTKRGSYLYKGDILNYMSGIDLSCNQLTGQIPPQLGNLTEIRALNLSHNNLSGVIPLTFSKLEQIESLDLSFNSLSGRIPPQLVELNALAVFSVAYNNLSGATPEQKAQFGTFDESSYEGNPLLCGQPLHNSCSQINSPPTVSTAPDDEGDESLVDMDAFYASFGVSCVVVLLTLVAVLYINPYWRQKWFWFIEDCITYIRFSRVGFFFIYIFSREARRYFIRP